MLKNLRQKKNIASVSKRVSKQLVELQEKLQSHSGESGVKFIFCNVTIPGLPEARAAHLTSIYGEMQKFVNDNRDILLGDLLDTTRMSLLIGKAFNVGKRQEDAQKYRTVFTEITKRTYNGNYNDGSDNIMCTKETPLDFLLLPTLALEELPPIEGNFKRWWNWWWWPTLTADVNDPNREKHLGDPFVPDNETYGNSMQQHDMVKKITAGTVRYLSIWNFIDVSVISMPLVTGEDGGEGTKWGKNAYSVQVIAKNDFKAFQGALAIQGRLDKYEKCRPVKGSSSETVDPNAICIDTDAEYIGRKGGNVVNYWDLIDKVVHPKQP